MVMMRHTTMLVLAAFLVGFGFGGVSLHYAQAQGLFGLTPSIQQIGSALADMQKNIDDLQKNLGTIKQVKEQLTALSPEGGGIIPKEGETFKKLIPGSGQ
jgi:hypothetical protein